MTLISLPSNAKYKGIVMSLERNVGMTQSPFTKQEQKFRWQGPRWMIDFNIPPIQGRANAADWLAFGTMMKGIENTFLMFDPSAPEPRGSAPGTPLVNGPSQAGSTLVTDGWTPNQNGILLKGDYIQVGAGVDARLHMIVADVNSDGAGQANLTIEPELRISPADGAAIVTSEACGHFRLVSNSFAWSVEEGEIYKFSFQAIEVI